MLNIGTLLAALAAILSIVAMAVDPGLDSGLRVANLSMMNFKLMLAVSGGALFVGGCALIAGGAIREAIFAVAQKHAEPSGVRGGSPTANNARLLSPSSPVGTPMLPPQNADISPSTTWNKHRNVEDPGYQAYLLARYPH